MLYLLLYPLHELFSALNIFRYITFRAVMAALSAFFISIIFGPSIIRFLKKIGITENTQKNNSKQLDDLHKNKKNTPTMGGILILLAIIIPTLLWADILNRQIIIVLFTTIWLGATGLLDDYLKKAHPNAKGLTAGTKFSSQIILGVILGVLLLYGNQSTCLDIPFVKNICIELIKYYFY